MKIIYDKKLIMKAVVYKSDDCKKWNFLYFIKDKRNDKNLANI